MKDKRVKWAISVKEKFANKINKIKEFPQWDGNRSAVIEHIFEKFFEKKGK